MINHPDIKFGCYENFNNLVDNINTINGLKLLLEAINTGYYPENHKVKYESDIKKLIKNYSMDLKDRLNEVDNYYSLSE